MLASGNQEIIAIILDEYYGCSCYTINVTVNNNLTQYDSSPQNFTDWITDVYTNILTNNTAQLSTVVVVVTVVYETASKYMTLTSYDTFEQEFIALQENLISVLLNVSNIIESDHDLSEEETISSISALETITIPILRNDDAQNHDQNYSTATMTVAYNSS